MTPHLLLGDPILVGLIHLGWMNEECCLASSGQRAKARARRQRGGGWKIVMAAEAAGSK